MIKKIALVDEDVVFIVRLMDYINQKKYGFEITSFTSVESLKEYSNKPNCYIDIVLINEKLEYDINNFFNKEQLKKTEVVILLEEKKEKGIFKYQKVDTIISELKKIAIKEKKEINEKFNRNFCVYSPIGRSGKTILSKALARSDEVRGGLYIGMEEFSGDNLNTRQDILYFIKTRQEDFNDKVNKLLNKKEDYSEIISTNNYSDLKELSIEDFQWFQNEIKKNVNFSTIVWDIGQASLNDISILSVFQNIIVPIVADEISKNKINNFKKHLIDKGLEDILRRIKYVKVPNVEYKNIEMTRLVSKIIE